jgi:hypothetical protein
MEEVGEMCLGILEGIRSRLLSDELLVDDEISDETLLLPSE